MHKNKHSHHLLRFVYIPTQYLQTFTDILSIYLLLLIFDKSTQRIEIRCIIHEGIGSLEAHYVKELVWCTMELSDKIWDHGYR